MKKIIDYLFYRYYMISVKNEEFPRFGATCVLAEVITMAYLFVVLILSFVLTGDFFTQYIGKNKNYIRDSRLFFAMAYNISTLQQKTDYSFIGKISRQ